MSFYAQRVFAAHMDLTEGRIEYDFWVNQLHARALLVSGSIVTLEGTRVAGEVDPIAP